MHGEYSTMKETLGAHDYEILLDWLQHPERHPDDVWFYIVTVDVVGDTWLQFWTDSDHGAFAQFVEEHDIFMDAIEDTYEES